MKGFLLKFCFTYLFFLFGVLLWAQPTNTNCNTAITILDPINYCSGPTEYNNLNAGPGNPAYGTPGCWNRSDNDVWFRFTAFANAVNIVVIGGTLPQPQIALYLDNGCIGTISELRCDSDGAGDQTANVFRGGLTIGQSYLIRIDGRGGQQGTFQLCIQNYNPPVEPGQDCPVGAILCDKSPFVVQSVSGGGADNDEAGSTCLSGSGGGASEMQSTWFQWTCDMPGSLTFILDPLRAGDDLDWALYELPSGIGNCLDKILLRCAANSPENPLSGCGDLTGMDLTSTDLEENFNCDAGEDGFVQFIDMEAGKSYSLIINNFTESGVGFAIEFGGTGTFLGPDPEFIIDPLEGLACETDFTVTDLSTFNPANGNIVSWDWNFGKGAIPPTAIGTSPGESHVVRYQSFGEKFITLTIETDQGCIVTEVLPLFAEPCCDDLMLDIDVVVDEVVDLLCADIPDGSIQVSGTGSIAPEEYMFAIDGGPFSLNGFFGNLDQGTYQINVVDLKGCEDSILVTVNAPPPIIVDAGPDITVDLGFDAQLNGTYTPVNTGDSISWSTNNPLGIGSLSCMDCLDPIAQAPGQTTYVLEVFDANGCSDIDSMTVFVELKYPIYGPNVISPNDDGLNDNFTIFGGPAAEIIEELYIFDRWGERIYYGELLPLNDPSVGWDGRFKGDRLVNQVFGWLAHVRFIDGTVQPITGSVTIVR